MTFALLCHPHPIVLHCNESYFSWKFNHNVNVVGTEERLKTISLGKYLSEYLVHDFYVWDPTSLSSLGQLSGTIKGHFVK